MNSSNSECRNSWLIVFYVFLIISFLCYALQGPNLAPDSGSYIHLSPDRAPLYPLFLALIQQCFGQYFQYAACLIQLLLSFFAFVYLEHWLRHRFQLPTLITLFITVLFIPPIYGIPFIHKIDLPMAGHVGTWLLSESLALPLFIFSVTRLTDFLYERKISQFIVATLLMIALLLTRPQFYFMWPVYFIAAIHAGVLNRCFKDFLRYFMVLIVGFVASFIVDHGYHYLTNGHFASNAALGNQLIVQPLFLSDAKDVHAFHLPKDQAIFTHMHQMMQQKGYLHDSTQYAMSPTKRYLFLYNPIMSVAANALKGTEFTSSYASNQKLTEIAVTLIKQHKFRYAQFYVQRIVVVGGFFLVLATALLFFINLYKIFSKPSRLQLLGFYASLITLGNLALVALVESLLFRYMIYAYLLLMCVIAIHIWKSLCAE